MNGGIRIDVAIWRLEDLDLERRPDQGLDAVRVERDDFDQVLQIGHRAMPHAGMLAERKRIVGPLAEASL